MLFQPLSSQRSGRSGTSQAHAVQETQQGGALLPGTAIIAVILPEVLPPMLHFRTAVVLRVRLQLIAVIVPQVKVLPAQTAPQQGAVTCLTTGHAAGMELQLRTVVPTLELHAPRIRIAAPARPAMAIAL